MTTHKVKRKKKQKDERVTAPLLSWKVALSALGVLYFLILGQAFILSAFLDQIPVLVSVLANYLLWICILLTVLFGLLWRYVIGKPLRKIAGAARRVAGGDFTVQIETFHKGKRKNEIDVLIDDFNKMTRELASNELLKNDFISNVSHEIKAPLSIIQSYAKAIKDTDLTDEQRGQYADTLIGASQNMSIMINNILKLNRLQNQEIKPAAKAYQLGEQLRRCALSFMEQWEKKHIDFVIDVVDTAVTYDASLLEIVWNNLLSNAIKFTDSGGKISLTSYLTETQVCVVFSDTGCGIDENVQKRIFDKFYQCDTSHATEGNGLGLALVKKVLEIVGGEITVKSAAGQGSEFTVKLNR